MNRVPKVDKKGIERLPFPADIVIETHGYCNLRCVVCPYPNLKRSKGEMDPALFRKIVDQVVDENRDVRLWVAIMGEPLMGKNLIAMLRYARDRGLRRLHLNTNATFLEGALADELLDAGLQEILVSLDAVTAETYGRIRVGGDFSRVTRNVEAFLAKRERCTGAVPKVITQFIVMDENEKELDAFKQFWLSRGAVVKVRLRLGWGLGVDAPDLRKTQLERFPCPWLLRTLSIQWNGLVNQCDGDFEGVYSPGDLNINSIKSVWNGELAKRRELHWNGDFTHPLCKDCRDWSGGRAEFFNPK